MLLPHVLLQVPEEAEGWQVRAPWALMLQQLPREKPQPPTQLALSVVQSRGTCQTPTQGQGTGSKSVVPALHEMTISISFLAFYRP